jgi:cytochrome P450
MDGAEHDAMREITREWFLPRNITKLENAIQHIAREFVDRMQILGAQCDFVTDISSWYPLRVILAIFGLPPEEAGRLLKLSKEFNGSQDPELRRSPSQGEHTLQILKEFFEYFATVAADRRDKPREDLASVIANATINGARLGDLEVFSYYLTISVAGHDTTSASTAGGLLALIQNPQQWDKLKANPMLVRTAVDEMVRWTHPVKHFFRTATKDYELRGKRIRAGDNLLMCYPSACRDEEAFDDPWSFRVDRAPNPHLAFGVGPHLCLGQYLAKIEMSAFYAEFLRRVSRIELNGDPDESNTLFMGGLKRLPIRYVMES